MKKNDEDKKKDKQDDEKKKDKDLTEDIYDTVINNAGFLYD